MISASGNGGGVVKKKDHLDPGGLAGLGAILLGVGSGAAWGWAMGMVVAGGALVLWAAVAVIGGRGR